MKKVLCALLLAVVFFSCQKNSSDDSSANEIYGRYTGTFNRTGGDTVNVSLFFKNNNTFEGSGNRLNYPALCGGNFSRSGTDLAVDDTCAWTANFDWTLIFDGNYKVNFTGANSVRIWRTNGAVTDEYLLTRFSR